MKFYFFLFIIIFPFVELFAANDKYEVNVFKFYVSTSGSDNNQGTLQNPFATLEMAKKAVAKLKNTIERNFVGKIVVFVRGGVYKLEKTFMLSAMDSGRVNLDIVYRSYPGELVRFTGAINIPINLLSSTKNEKLSSSSTALKSKIISVNLDKLGYTNISVFHWDRPKPIGGLLNVPAPEELIVNNEIYELARWPNSEWDRTGSIENKNLITFGSKSKKKKYFHFTNTRISKWQSTDAWVNGFWKWDWYDDAIPVMSIDEENGNVLLSRSSHYGISENKRFYIFNLLSELDAEGEYYIDRKERVLYFYNNKEYLGAGSINLTVLDQPLLQLDNVSNVLIKGLIFESGRDKAIVINGGREVVLDELTIRNIGNAGIVINGGKNNIVKNSILYAIGTHAIVVKGGDRKKLKYSYHKILGNDISDYGRRIIAGSVGVYLKGVGNYIANNKIYNAPHIGVWFQGNDNIIEYNVIDNVCNDTADAGAIYSGRDWAARGNKIRFNLIKNIQGIESNKDVTAIYLDDMISGTKVSGNLIINSVRGVLVGGGRDNVIENNICAYCSTPLSIDARGLTWLNTKTLYSRLKAVPYSSEVWKNKYPNLASLLDDSPLFPKNNIIQSNYYFRSGLPSVNIIASNLGEFKNNYQDDKNPGFIDPERRDFRFRSNQYLSKLLPDWIDQPLFSVSIHNAPY